MEMFLDLPTFSSMVEAAALTAAYCRLPKPDQNVINVEENLKNLWCNLEEYLKRVVEKFENIR